MEGRLREIVAALIAAGGGGGVVASGLLGGVDVALQGLLTLMVLDLITGLLHAAVERKLDSKIGFKGIVRKIGYLVAVMVGVLFDRVTGMQAPLARTVVILFLFSVESLSILEHLALLGVPVPKWLVERLRKLQGDSDAGSLESGAAAAAPPPRPIPRPRLRSLI